MSSEERDVIPGERLGRVSDFQGGRGTYTRDQGVFASVVGRTKQVLFGAVRTSLFVPAAESVAGWQDKMIEVVREGEQRTVVPAVGDIVLCKVRQQQQLARSTDRLPGGASHTKKRHDCHHVRGRYGPEGELQWHDQVLLHNTLTPACVCETLPVALELSLSNSLFARLNYTPRTTPLTELRIFGPLRRIEWMCTSAFGLEMW